MIYFHNDYLEGCHEKVLAALTKTNLEQTPGYGEDHYCAEAARLIRQACNCENAAVHFLVGGTQANLTVVAAALRPHQAAMCAVSGHINSHETGAVEATGHKVMTVPSEDGKITAHQVRQVVDAHYADESFEHTTQPKLVYISSPTELGTLYSLSELEALSAVCREKGLYLFLDGARLGYGLAAKDNEVTLADLARLCDVFYIGGTKVGALFGEAVVITNPVLAQDFRYIMKQHGGMLAKGRLLGVQFKALFEDGLYFRIGAHAVALADQIRHTLDEMGVDYLVPGTTNQIFPILSDACLDELARDFKFVEMERVSPTHRAVRFCTSWATNQENTDALCAALRRIVFTIC
ncbi:MAG: aminotransferase class I/II-fold pyridoxal phosphate-dependent enzyme [Oscillospiraceae bacterium]|nr:aminotransferase class I/II-fold pyridoxal phosphate-dependent enzyme [Oscillospiraceae bacterium]